MKVGDLVKIVIPKGKTSGLDLSRERIDEDEALEGIIIWKWAGHWWEILRNDLSVVQRFHTNWCEVINESR